MSSINFGGWVSIFSGPRRLPKHPRILEQPQTSVARRRSIPARRARPNLEVGNAAWTFHRAPASDRKAMKRSFLCLRAGPTSHTQHPARRISDATIPEPFCGWSHRKRVPPMRGSRSEPTVRIARVNQPLQFVQHGMRNSLISQVEFRKPWRRLRTVCWVQQNFSCR